MKSFVVVAGTLLASQYLQNINKWSIIIAMTAILLAYKLMNKYHIFCSKTQCRICLPANLNYTFRCFDCTKHECFGRRGKMNSPEERCNCHCHTQPNCSASTGQCDGTCAIEGKPCGAKQKERMREGGRPCKCPQCTTEGPLLRYNYEFLNHSKTAEWKNRIQTKNGNDVYDVVYVGGGIASLLSAYHMVVHAEGGKTITMAVVDPRNEKRDNLQKDLKVGESLVTPSAAFLIRDLGLLDYLIEHSPPKHGLYFWWAKNPNNGKTSSQSDYIGLYEPHPHEFGAYQLNRATFEAMLVEKCKAAGVRYIQGFGKVAELATGGNLHTIVITPVKPEEDEGIASEDGFQPVERSDFAGQRITIHARQLVDGAGRKFLIGNMRNTMLKDPKDLYNVNNSSVWVRIKNQDLTFPGMFHGDSNWMVHKAYSSYWYCTGHYMGVGHWIWVIPIEKYGAREVSIGVSFHKDVIPLNTMNSVEKFYAFLKANHEVLYKLCSTAELIDFQVLPKLPHLNTQPLGYDNWYSIGEAFYNVDPIYSTGLVVTTQQVQHINTLIYAKFANAPKEHVDDMIDAYNTIEVAVARRLIHQISHHSKQLGNCSVMSWRMFHEASNAHLATINAQTRWMSCPLFCRAAAKALVHTNENLETLYTILDEIHDKGINPGFVNFYAEGEVSMFGLFKKWKPFDLFHVEHSEMCSNFQWDYQRANVFRALRNSNFYFVVSFSMLIYRSFGIAGYFRPMVLKALARALAASCFLGIKGYLYDRQLAKEMKPNSLNNYYLYLQHEKTYQRALKPRPW